MNILNCSHLNFCLPPPAYLSEGRLLRPCINENSSTNCIQKGLNWLSRQQIKYAASQVIYFRDKKEFTVNAVLGRTRYELVDDNGFRIAGHAIDFLIRSVELEFTPQAGDQIIANGLIYEVIDLGDGCWQWCDPHGIMRRIHTTIYKEKS